MTTYDQCLLYCTMKKPKYSTHQDRAFSMEAAMFFMFLYQLKATKGSLTCLEREGEDRGEDRGVQLQHETSTLDITIIKH